MAQEVEAPMHVIGYCRLSKDEAGGAAGLEAQRQTIEGEAERRGWSVEWITDHGYTAGNLKRPGIQQALALLDAGEAEAIVVSRLDRLSRSVFDFAGLLERARGRWSVVALDVAVDTSTPAGEALVNVLATFAQFERRLIGQRTREALAIKRAQGVRLGRERVIGEEVEQRALELRAEGLSIRAVGDVLAAEGHTPPSGGAWQPSTLHRILSRPAVVA
jgi:DNA invertase Pin-like site-specific DNA recombinase